MCWLHDIMHVLTTPKRWRYCCVLIVMMLSWLPFWERVMGIFGLFITIPRMKKCMDRSSWDVLESRTLLWRNGLWRITFGVFGSFRRFESYDGMVRCYRMTTITVLIRTLIGFRLAKVGEMQKTNDLILLNFFYSKRSSKGTPSYFLAQTPAILSSHNQGNRQGLAV